jgi:hypothetical protein
VCRSTRRSSRSRGRRNLRRSGWRLRRCGPKPCGLGGSILGSFFRFRLGLGGSFGRGKRVEMRANFFRRREVDRARVGLLLSDAGLGQVVDDRLGLYFEIAGQFIDADLIDVRHSSVDFSFGSSPTCSASAGPSEDDSDSA